MIEPSLSLLKADSKDNTKQESRLLINDSLIRFNFSILAKRDIARKVVGIKSQIN